MEDSVRAGTRPRARSDAPSHAPSHASGRPAHLTVNTAADDLNRSVSPRGRAQASFDGNETFEPQLPRRAATSRENISSPRRPRADTVTTHNLSLFPTGDLRRRSTALSRRSAAQGRPSGVGERSQYTTLAGPDPSTQLAQSYENYVSPGYDQLNPSYAQPAAAKPVWSLAKPLPRVVRPGMVPTKSEILEARANAELPAENSQKVGLDVDPNDLEEGRVKFHPNPAVLAAQLKDSRAQRENNFISTAAAQGGTQPGRRISLVDRQSLHIRRPRASTAASLGRPMSPTAEDEEEGHTSEQGSEGQGARLEPTKSRRSHDDHMATIPEGQEPVTLQDDNASLSTLAADPADWAEIDPLKVEPPALFDEIHNNHTAWSVVRTHHREFLAEFLGVFMQLTIGFCVDLAHTCMNSQNPNYTAWGWGFATMVGIYVSGGISGAHLNPAISFMLWFFRGFPKRKLPEYWFAQFLGAFIAAFTAYGLYSASINNYLAVNAHSLSARTDIANSFVTSQRYAYIDPATAFFNEFVGTAMLAATILALGDDQNAPPGAGMNSLIIGFVNSLEIFAFGFQTGAALNPSRDFGPRLALLALGYGRKLFTNPYWFYGPVAATFCGAFVGACLYDVAIFTGGESPVNYPWTRTKRSFKKGKAKWSRRLLHTKRDAIEDTHWNQQANA